MSELRGSSEERERERRERRRDAKEGRNLPSSSSLVARSLALSTFGVCRPVLPALFGHFCLHQGTERLLGSLFIEERDRKEPRQGAKKRSKGPKKTHQSKAKNDARRPLFFQPQPQQKQSCCRRRPALAQPLPPLPRPRWPRARRGIHVEGPVCVSVGVERKVSFFPFLRLFSFSLSCSLLRNRKKLKKKNFFPKPPTYSSDSTTSSSTRCCWRPLRLTARP